QAIEIHPHELRVEPEPPRLLLRHLEIAIGDVDPEVELGPRPSIEVPQDVARTAADVGDALSRLGQSVEVDPTSEGHPSRHELAKVMVEPRIRQKGVLRVPRHGSVLLRGAARRRRELVPRGRSGYPTPAATDVNGRVSMRMGLFPISDRAR